MEPKKSNLKKDTPCTLLQTGKTTHPDELVANLRQNLRKRALQFVRNHVGAGHEIGMEEFAANAHIKLETVKRYLYKHGDGLSDESMERVAWGLAGFWERMLEVYVGKEMSEFFDIPDVEEVVRRIPRKSHDALMESVREKALLQLRSDFLYAFGNAGSMALESIRENEQNKQNGQNKQNEQNKLVCSYLHDKYNMIANLGK